MSYGSLPTTRKFWGAARAKGADKLDTITVEYASITTDLVLLKRKKSDPILTVKRTEWRKFIDYFGLSIKANQSRVGKKNAYFVHIGYIKPLSL